MSTRKSKKQGSKPTQKPWLKKLVYLVAMLLSGGGIGGYSFKDHPQAKALISLILGTPIDPSEERPITNKIVGVVKGVLNRDDPRDPGVFEVRISKVTMDPSLFRQGRTIDLQARVRRINTEGEETQVWDSRSFGENLAVVGRDEVSADFSNRPFEMEWTPTDRVLVEVWDRKSGLFDRRELRMTPPTPGTFPLATGSRPLVTVGREKDPINGELNRIAFESKRIGGLKDDRTMDPKQIAERPIVIK